MLVGPIQRHGGFEIRQGCKVIAAPHQRLSEHAMADQERAGGGLLQQVLAQPHWSGKLTARDLSPLTPLFWEHVNPYGRFELDIDARLPID
jgi:Tn3 transposase DDE domain